jgi:ribose/xylose/arabinose/galactoside ABC-type transport system permease subunit
MMLRRRLQEDLLAVPHRLVPTLALGMTLVAYLALPAYSGAPLTSFDNYNALQVFARLGPLVLALGLTMLAGEFDLSVVGTYALGGMLAVQHGSESWIHGVVLALALGAAIGLAQGVVIAGLGVPSMPVTLATYIALLGLTNALSGGLSVSYNNPGVTLWVDSMLAGVFSPRSAIALGAFLVIGTLLGCSRWGREVRAIGSDRRASRVSGVESGRILIALFATSGTLAAGAGALLNFSLGAANPDPGVQPLILAASGALLGGVSLSGGQGSIPGLLAGALTVAFLSQIVTAAHLPNYTAQLFYANLLALIVLVEAPGLRRAWTRARVRLESVSDGEPARTRHQLRKVLD